MSPILTFQIHVGPTKCFTFLCLAQSPPLSSVCLSVRLSVCVCLSFSFFLESHTLSCFVIRLASVMSGSVSVIILKTKTHHEKRWPSYFRCVSLKCRGPLKTVDFWQKCQYLTPIYHSIPDTNGIKNSKITYSTGWTSVRSSRRLDWIYPGIIQGLSRDREVLKI